MIKRNEYTEHLKRVCVIIFLLFFLVAPFEWYREKQLKKNHPMEVEKTITDSSAVSKKLDTIHKGK